MIRLIIALLFTQVLLIGCSSSLSSYDSTPPFTGPFDKVHLYGEVIVLDNNCNPVSDRSGVLVDIDSGKYTTITDAKGHWECPSYSTGDYSLFHCSKPGYYSTEQQLYINNYYSAESLQPLIIGTAPTFGITLDAVFMPDAPPDSITTYSGYIYCHTSEDVPDSAVLGIYVIVGLSPYLAKEYPSTYTTAFTAFGVGQPGSGSRSINSSFDWKSISVFKPNETVYFKVYPIFGASIYFDPRSMKYVSNGSGNIGSNILSGVMK